MRLVTFQSDAGWPSIGVIRDDSIIDLATWLSPPDGSYQRGPLDMLDLITWGGEGLDRVRAALEAAKDDLQAAGALVPLEPRRLLAPIPKPRKNIVCLGRNYAAHRAESARAWGEELTEQPPEYPAIFTKAPTAVIGPYGDIPFDPSISERMDYEAELALIIGRNGKNIKRAEAMSYIFGYMVLNDVTARDAQKRYGDQWFKGKSLDGSCPTGPWIVTADELPNPNNLDISCLVNGVEKQRDNTRSMIIDVAGIVEAISLGMTLEPGDIVATGTPEGVGFARQPPEFLRPGDVVECAVQGIGAIRNRLVMRKT